MSFSKHTTQDQTMKKEIQSLLNAIQDLSVKFDKMNTKLDTFEERSTKQIQQLQEIMTQQKSQIADIERSLNDTEGRLSEQDLQLHFLSQQNASLQNKIEDLENRSRRNNLRIYGLPEKTEGDNMVTFLTTWLPEVLKLPEALSYGIERAHRSLRAASSTIKSKNHPRSIIVKFFSSQDKELILKTAWSTSPVKYKDNIIRFDNDYSAGVITARKECLPLIKELKKRQLKVHLLFPARIKIFFTEGPKTFDTLQATVSYLSANKTLDNVEEMDFSQFGVKRHLEKNEWSTADKKKKKR